MWKVQNHQTTLTTKWLLEPRSFAINKTKKVDKKGMNYGILSTYSSLDISDEPILEFWHLKQKCGFEANWPSIQNINQST